jgi:hypothetical protein
MEKRKVTVSVLVGLGWGVGASNWNEGYEEWWGNLGQYLHAKLRSSEDNIEMDFKEIRDDDDGKWVKSVQDRVPWGQGGDAVTVLLKLAKVEAYSYHISCVYVRLSLFYLCVGVV